MERWYRFCGIVGAVLLSFGFVLGLIIGDFLNIFALTHTTLGVVFIVGWFVMSGMSSLSHAGTMIQGRTARFSANVALYGAVFVGLLIVVNYLAHRYDRRLDLTEQGVYSLAPQSAEVVAGLKKNLKLVGISAGEMGDEVHSRELLELYRQANAAMVSVDTFDPRAKPHLVETYGVKPGNLVYLEYGDGDTKGVSRINDLTEEAITNAIIKLTRGDAKKLYFVQGHDEPGIQVDGGQGAKNLADALQDEHLITDTIVLSQIGSIPADAAGVVLMSPKRPLLAAEKELLTSYVDGGGRLLMFHDPRTTNDVRELANHFGITVGDDIVIDQVQRMFAAPALGAQPIVTTYDPTHPITKAFTNQTITVFNIASTVKGGAAAAGVTYAELAKTGPSAWGEKNVAALFDSAEPTAQKDPEDVAGPVTLAVAYEKKIGAAGGGDTGASTPSDKTARVVVFGDGDWGTNEFFGVYHNRDLFLNSVNWTIGQEGGVSIRARSLKSSVQPITGESFMLIMALSFLVPELILLAGLLVWWNRRTAVFTAV